MLASDAQWLQVKQDWLPIESILSDLVPGVESAKEKIDLLSCQLEAQTVKDLHYLRMERNRLMHKGHAITNLDRWISAAGDARAKLEVMQARQHTAAREAELQASARTMQGASSNQAVNDGSSTGNLPSAGEFLARVLVKLAVWCASSWYLHTGVMFVLTSVATYSAAWWLLHAIGVLCWPGIALAYLLYAIGLALVWMGEAVFAGCVWLIKYIIANPF